VLARWCDVRMAGEVMGECGLDAVDECITQRPDKTRVHRVAVDRRMPRHVAQQLTLRLVEHAELRPTLVRQVGLQEPAELLAEEVRGVAACR
jgi:hypothetical protein